MVSWDVQKLKTKIKVTKKYLKHQGIKAINK
jgi:hypothetical protein